MTSQKYYLLGSIAFFSASTWLLFQATTWVDRLGLLVYMLGSYCFFLGTTRKRT